MSAADQDQIRQTLRSFVLGSVPGADLDDDANLFESGIVNSLFAVQLMTFIERTFAIVVGKDDLDIKNFKSLNAATAFVLQKNGRRNA
ncbi:MAG: acyl carrier protein [Burkholderiales bacterium]